MSDLLAEVDEAMRQEKLAKFWHENATLIITFVVGTILMTAAFSGYYAWDDNVKETQTDTLITLVESPDYPSNIANADLDIRPDAKAIAKLGAADALLRRDKKQDAQKLYTEIAQDNKSPAEFQQLAAIMSVRLALADAENAPDADALLEMLKLAQKQNTPFWPHANIEAASIHAHLKDDFETAKNLLSAITETPDLPPSLYERAQSLHHVYALKQKETMSQ